MKGANPANRLVIGLVGQTCPSADGIHNDGDGDIDMADGRCLDANDDTENS